MLNFTLCKPVGDPLFLVGADEEDKPPGKTQISEKRMIKHESISF